MTAVALPFNNPLRALARSPGVVEVVLVLLDVGFVATFMGC